MAAAVVIRCRMCGSPPGPAETFGDFFGDGGVLSYMVEHVGLLFGIRVEPGDASTALCDACVRAVNDFYAYYLRVREAQSYFPHHKPQDPKPSVFQHFLADDNLSLSDQIKEESIELPNSAAGGGGTSNDLCIQTLKVEDYNDNDNDDDNDDFRSDDDNNTHGQYSGERYSQNVKSSREKKYKKRSHSNKAKAKAKMKKSKSRRRKERDYSESDDDSDEDDESIMVLKEKDVSEFPTEVIKDGKMIIKGAKLDLLICKFYKLECSMCPQRPAFKSLKTVMKHYHNEHKTKGYLECCDSRLYQRIAIYMHMAKHLQPSAFECPICKKAVSRPSSLKIHLGTHLAREEKPYDCDQCEKRYICFDQLNRHKMTHVPIEKRETYECKICRKVFTLHVTYLHHMRDGHSGTKFLCTECGRGFTTKGKLTVHMSRHDTTGKYEVKCDVCGLVCKNKHTYSLHMKIHSDKKLQCTMCEFTTPYQHRLNLHIRVRHTDEKPFTCDFCGKQFKMKKGLEMHVALHTGERKYSCAFCTRTFSANTNYYTHMKKDHPEQHQKAMLMRRKTKYRELNPAAVINDKQNESHINEMAKMYLQQIAERNVKKS